MEKLITMTETQKKLIDLLYSQVVDLTMMSKIELGNDVIEEIKRLMSKLKENNMEKESPIDIVPREVWLESRLNLINLAIDEYLRIDYAIPVTLIQERNNILLDLGYGNGEN
jgi:hypothetical protein